MEYPALSHDLQTSEGMFEQGDFFTRLTENAQAIESCFPQEWEFERQHLKLEEIGKAQNHVRGSRLFKGLSDPEKKYLLKTVEEQILHPQIESLKITPGLIEDMKRDAFWETLKDPDTDQNLAIAGAFQALKTALMGGIDPVSTVDSILSPYYLYKTHEEQDAQLKKGIETKDGALVFDVASAEGREGAFMTLQLGMMLATILIGGKVGAKMMAAEGGAASSLPKGLSLPKVFSEPLVAANDNAIPLDIIPISRARGTGFNGSVQSAPSSQPQFSTTPGPVKGIVAYLSEGNAALQAQPIETPVPETPQAQPTPALPEPATLPQSNTLGFVQRVFTGLSEIFRVRDLIKIPLIPMVAPEWDYFQNRLKTITEVQLEKLKESAYKNNESSPNAVQASGGSEKGGQEGLGDSKGEGGTRKSHEGKNEKIRRLANIALSPDFKGDADDFIKDIWNEGGSKPYTLLLIGKIVSSSNYRGDHDARIREIQSYGESPDAIAGVIGEIAVSSNYKGDPDARIREVLNSGASPNTVASVIGHIAMSSNYKGDHDARIRELQQSGASPHEILNATGNIVSNSNYIGDRDARILEIQNSGASPDSIVKGIRNVVSRSSYKGDHDARIREVQNSGADPESIIVALGEIVGSSSYKGDLDEWIPYIRDSGADSGLIVGAIGKIASSPNYRGDRKARVREIQDLEGNSRSAVSAVGWIASDPKFDGDFNAIIQYVLNSEVAHLYQFDVLTESPLMQLPGRL